MSKVRRIVTLETMRSFTVDEVGYWLCQIGLNDFTAKFLDGDIDGQKLVNLQTFQLNYFFGNNKKRERQFWELLQSIIHKRTRTAPPVPSGNKVRFLLNTTVKVFYKAVAGNSLFPMSDFVDIALNMFGKANFPKLRQPPKPQGGYHHPPSKAFSNLNVNQQESDDEFSDDDEPYLMENQMESYPVPGNQRENYPKPDVAAPWATPSTPNRFEPQSIPKSPRHSIPNYTKCNPNLKTGIGHRPQPAAPHPNLQGVFSNSPFPGPPPPRPAKNRIPDPDEDYLTFEGEDVQLTPPSHPFHKPMHAPRRPSQTDRPLMPLPPFDKHLNFPLQDSFPKRAPPIPPNQFTAIRYQGINGGDSTGNSPNSSRSPSRESSLTSRIPSREPSVTSPSHVPYRNNSGGSTSSSTSDEDRNRNSKKINPPRLQEFHTSKFPTGRLPFPVVMPPYEPSESNNNEPGNVVAQLRSRFNSQNLTNIPGNSHASNLISKPSIPNQQLRISESDEQRRPYNAPALPPKTRYAVQLGYDDGGETKVEDQNWFKDIDRHEAQKLVEYKEPGNFIVRPRDSIMEPYALTLWGPKDKIYNFKIRKREDKNYALGTEKSGEKTFQSVVDLIEHHMKSNVILEKGEGEVLLVPC